MNMYTPSSPYFDPMDVDRYFSHRAKEAIDATLSGTPEKIDGPQFLDDWVNLCKDHFKWLWRIGIVGVHTLELRQLSEQAITELRDRKIADISGDIDEIQATVVAYEEKFGTLSDVRAAAEKQIGVLEALQQRYKGLQQI